MSILGAAASGLRSLRNVTVTTRRDYGIGPLGLRTASSAPDKLYGQSPTLFPIVNKNANSTAAVNWHMHRTKNLRTRTACEVCGEEGAVNVDVHPALTVWNSPNPFQNRQEFVEAFQQHVDLCGETFWIVEFVPGTTMPMHMWLRQPHLMSEVPGDELYQPALAGWESRLKDGRVVSFELEEVIQVKMPDPSNPYRGIGPVQALMKNLGFEQEVAQWQASFYRNAAITPAIIGVLPNGQQQVSTDELKLAKADFEQKHMGMNNAGKLAWMNYDVKVTQLQYSQADMQQVEALAQNSETIRKAFNFPKFYLGEPEDSNRAASEAAKDFYNEELIKPRLERIKQVLNDDFLPMFGSTGQGVQFVYTDPVQGNVELKNATRESQARTFKTYVGAGLEADDAAYLSGLPAGLRMKESSVEEEVAA